MQDTKGKTKGCQALQKKLWKDNKMANFWLGFIWSNNREREEIIYFNLIQLEIILSFWKLLYFIWRFFYFWKF